MSEPIDIGTLFADMLPDPMKAQRDEGVRLSDLVSGGGSAAAYYAPQREATLRNALGGMFGVDTRTPADIVRAQLAAASSQKQTPESLIRLAKLIENTDPQKAAQFRQAATQMQVQEAEQVRQQSYRNTVARRAANSPRFRADVAAITDGTLPQSEVDRIYTELTKAEEPTDLDPFQAILPDGTQQTVLYDGKGGYYDVTEPTKKITLEEDTQLFRSSQVGAPTDYANPQEVGLKQSQIDTAQFTTGVNNVIKALEENPDANTAVARLGGVFNNLVQEAEAVLNLENKGDRTELFKRLDIGVDSAAMQSMLIGLAYQAAKAEGQRGRDVSNADIERFMRQLGANSADPRVLTQNLTRLKKEAQDRFATQYSFVRNAPWQGSFEPIQVQPTSGATDGTGTPDFSK